MSSRPRPTASAWCARAFFGHEAPDGTGLRERLPDEGPRFDKAAENLGLGSGPLAAHFDAATTLDQFRNLLNPAFRFVGLGVAMALEPLALAHARRALERDEPELSDPLVLARSMNLSDSSYNRTAIGLARGSSPKHGKDQ